MRATLKTILEKLLANIKELHSSLKSPLKNWCIFAILVIACFLTYYNALFGAFVSHDDFTIPEYSPPSSWLLVWHHPISLFDYLIFKSGWNNPYVYHLANVLLHCLNTIMVFIFLKLFFGKKASFWGAVIFAVHPIHTETVTWVSGRGHLFIAFLMFFTYLFYRKFVNQANFLYYLFSLIIFYYWTTYTIGISLIFPIFIILSDIYLGKTKNAWRSWLPFCFIAIFGLITHSVEISSRLQINMVSEGGTATGLERFIFRTILFFGDYNHYLKVWWVLPWYSFVHNLRLTLFPFTLNFYHEPIHIYFNSPIFNWLYWLYFLTAVFLIWKYIKKFTKEILFVTCFFILFLSPTFSFIPVSSLIAERYLYLPSIALSMLLALGYEKIRFKKIYLIFLILIIGLFMAKTITRNMDYYSLIRFWEAEVKFSPDSARTRNDLGYAYLGEERYDEAISQFKLAMKIDPQANRPIQNIILAYGLQGKEVKQMRYNYRKKKWKVIFSNFPLSVF